MEIRNLLTFAKVAEAQSLSEAARELGYAQSTVTMQMQQLERELGVSVYERIGKKIRITQEGQELLTYAIPIIRMSREAQQIGRRAPGEISGLLRLGVADILGGAALAGKIRHFGERCPRAELRIRRAADSGELKALLLKNEIDVMVTVDEPLADPALVCGGQRKTGLSFVASAVHPLAGKKRVTRAELFRHRLIRLAGESPWERALGRWLEGSPGQLTVDSGDLAARLAIEQAGIWLAPDCAAREYLEDGRLAVLRCEPPEVELWEQTIYHKNKWMTQAMSAWLSMPEDTR